MDRVFGSDEDKDTSWRLAETPRTLEVCFIITVIAAGRRIGRRWCTSFARPKTGNEEQVVQRIVLGLEDRFRGY